MAEEEAGAPGDPLRGGRAAAQALRHAAQILATASLHRGASREKKRGPRPRGPAATGRSTRRPAPRCPPPDPVGLARRAKGSTPRRRRVTSSSCGRPPGRRRGRRSSRGRAGPPALLLPPFCPRRPGLTRRSSSSRPPPPPGLEPHRCDALLETLGWTSCLAAEGFAPQLLLRRDAETADLLQELTGALCAAFLELVSCQSLRDAELQKTAGILAGSLMSLCHQQADAKLSLTDCIVLLKHSVPQLVAAQADAHSDFRAALVAKTLGFVYYCQWRAAKTVRPRRGRAGPAAREAARSVRRLTPRAPRPPPSRRCCCSSGPRWGG